MSNEKDCACGHGKSSHSYGYYQCYHEDCGCMKFTKQEPFPNNNWTGKMADAEDKCESVNVNSEATEASSTEMKHDTFGHAVAALAKHIGECDEWMEHDHLCRAIREHLGQFVAQERHQRDVYQKAAATASNYIADDDTFPTTIWLACGRKVKIECAQPMLEGPQPYLTVETEMHPSFEGKI